MNFNPKCHWEKIYQEKGPAQVSWYQTKPSVSLDTILSTKIGLDEGIIDVGGGTSSLVNNLLKEGFKDITVLDISAKALQYAKERLGDKVQSVNWIESDVIKFQPSRQYTLWHDRAVFHFFTDPSHRKQYIEIMKKAIKSDGHVIIATFASDGPLKCSGLNVERYDPKKLSREIGKSFRFIKSIEEIHITPWHSEQKFIYSVFRKCSLEVNGKEYRQSQQQTREES